MSNVQITVEDVESLAAKLDGLPGLDDHDRAVLADLYAWAVMGKSQQPEVTAFGTPGPCTCSFTIGEAFKWSKTCPVHQPTTRTTW